MKVVVQLLQINHSLLQFLEREKMVVHVDSVMRGHVLMGRVLHIHTTTSRVNG